MSCYSTCKRFARGFTLIEILIVLGIIAVLAAVVLVAVNPGRQFAEARNTQRLSNVTTILNAIGQRIIDGRGTFAGSFWNGTGTSTCPAVIAGTLYDIASPGSQGSTIDLSCLVPTYLPGSLPSDPGDPNAHWQSPTSYHTGYQLILDTNGRYTVSAPSVELGETISVTR